MKVTMENLREWNDGQTVCPPCLVGDYDGLAEWCIDTLSAVVGGGSIPDPEEYRTKPDGVSP